MRISSEQLHAILRCPATGGTLVPDADGNALVEPDSSRKYPIIAGVPVLVDPDRSLFGIPSGIAGASPVAATNDNRLIEILKGLARKLPTNSRNIGSAENFREFRRLLNNMGSTPPLLLVIGGRIPGVGAAEVLDAEELEVIETDVASGPRVELICDGHDLPFADGSFDGVICQAVLEHVVDPARVASEVHRVLKTNGLVYSEVPFMQQVHEGAYDFHRFTHIGHRRLWRFFDEIRSGAQGGPGMALGWSIQYFIQSFANSKATIFILGGIARVATSWLTIFDPLLVQRPGGVDAASGTYFLGRRRRTALPDREILRAFRGN